MSLNPAIQPRTGVPVGLEGEAFLVRRNGMSCKIIVKDMVPLESTGSLFLTNLRLIFVCAKPVMVQGCLFSSFNFPLNTLKNEEFKQPIFGCNHLIGTVEPINGRGIQNSISFKLFFSQGVAPSCSILYVLEFCIVFGLCMHYNRHTTFWLFTPRITRYDALKA